MTDDTEPHRPSDPMRVTAADVMSSPAVTLSADATLADAWEILFGHGIRHVVVTARGGRVVGVLDDRRLALEWPLGPLGPHRRRLDDVVPESVHCVLPATPLAVVARTMARELLDAVPVVLAGGTVVGIVTSGDVVAYVGRAARRPVAATGS